MVLLPHGFSLLKANQLLPGGWVCLDMLFEPVSASDLYTGLPGPRGFPPNTGVYGPQGNRRCELVLDLKARHAMVPRRLLASLFQRVPFQCIVEQCRQRGTDEARLRCPPINV